MNIERTLLGVWAKQFGCFVTNEGEIVVEDTGEIVAHVQESIYSRHKGFTFKIRMVKPLTYIQVEGTVSL